MQKLRVDNFSISIDGFGAGPDQTLNDPLGKNGMELHQWFFPTDTFQQMVSGKPGEKGVDNDIAAKGLEQAGACIMGRNMFGPIRGSWPDDEWKGWWGENPPFHCPVFVLTHHPRASIKMEGGTTFHFVTEGIHEALRRAREAANGMDIRVCGGVSTIRQFLKEGLVDELRIAISPVILGQGEHLFNGIDLVSLDYKCVGNTASSKAMHIAIARNE